MSNHEELSANSDGENSSGKEQQAVIRYDPRDILAMRDLPLSHRKLDLPGWFMLQAARKQPSAEPEPPRDRPPVPPPHAPIPLQMGARAAARGFSCPVYAFPGRPVLGRSDHEVPTAELQRAVMEFPLEPRRRISCPVLSPRPPNHFHHRRTLPWSPLPLHPFMAAPGRGPWPIPYFKSFGVAHGSFPDGSTFITSPCYH